MENERYRQLLNQIVLTDGPYPLTHFDFGIYNVLVDDGGDIVGVIDWSGVGVYPWEVFAQYPEPLRITWPLRHMYSEQNWKPHIEDQGYFKEALRKCERERGLPEIVSSDRFGIETNCRRNFGNWMWAGKVEEAMDGHHGGD